MNPRTLGWLVFLALIKSFYFAPPYAKLLDTNVTATEGSCFEIRCEINNRVSDAHGAFWFWLKDAKWIDAAGDFNGTVIYSTNASQRPVSPDFAGRVKYTGSLFSSWNIEQPNRRCNILICNLKKSDSGRFAFRYTQGSVKWSTNPNTTLTVTENPCPITFVNPPAVLENQQVTLTCSTSSSCPSRPQIEDLSASSSSQLLRRQQSRTNTTVSFTAGWQDDGRLFSCHTENNMDEYLIRNVTVTVEYAPKDVSAEKSSENVKEGGSVTLTCSAKGAPAPNVTWVTNEQAVSTEAVWTISNIKPVHSGEYRCKAQNKHGTKTSAPVSIDVTFPPVVEITPTSSEFSEGDLMTLTCNVTKSNPLPHSYAWWKNQKKITDTQKYLVNSMTPENKGSYTCTATNSVGAGTSRPLQIKVNYRPRRTNIITSGFDAIYNKAFSFTCNTDAFPPPSQFSWYRFNNNKQITYSTWTSKTTFTNILQLGNVQRGDEGSYRCNATNRIGTGEDSEAVTIQVQYPPTQPVLSMVEELTENMTITIICTVESFPLSELTVRKASTSKPFDSKPIFSHLGSYWPDNRLQIIFNVTSVHDGFYTCEASNRLGSNTSKQRKLVVKYGPKDVTVQAQPAFDVTENTSLTLSCSARSFPQVSSVTWMKMTNGKEEVIKKSQLLVIRSASPSDIGQYSCLAKNDIGTGKSKTMQVHVRYAPKHTSIIRAAERREPDGRRSVTLSCISDGHPPVNEYFWYKKGNSMNTVKRQNFTVYSDKPGDYYCVAKNTISQKASEPVTVFDGRFMLFLKIFLSLLLLLLLVLLIFFVYRYRRKKSVQQGTTRTHFGLPGWSNGVGRGNLIHESILSVPFRTRDVLLPDQHIYSEAQRSQPHPDSTPVPSVSSVYCTVNMPHRKQAPAAQKPPRLQVGHTMEDSLNYASLAFKEKQSNKRVKPEEETVYAKVCKSNPPNKPDYENVSSTGAAKSPAPLYDDDDDSSSSDSSEDEVQLNYTQVSFTAKPGHQRKTSDTSSDTSSETSSEDEVHYSDVKM